MLKVDLYAYDYSGYGISTGRPSEKNIYADIEAAYKHITESEGPHVRVVLNLQLLLTNDFMKYFFPIITLSQYATYHYSISV